MTDQRVLVLTWKLHATFQCERYNIFKKKLNLFFAHENLKNKPKKLLIIGPKLFSHSTGPAAPTSQEFIFIL